MAATPLGAWMAGQYAAAAQGEGLPKELDGLLAGFPARTEIGEQSLPLSGFNRMRNFVHMRYNYPLGAEGYTLALLAANGAHYGVAMWRRGAAAPEYVCFRPAFDSRDGEYRSGFQRWPDFLENWETHAASLAPFEAAALELVAQGELALDVTAFPASAAADVVRAAEDARVGVVAFAAALALGLARLAREDRPPHSSAAVAALFGRIAAARPELVAAAARLEDDAYYDLNTGDAHSLMAVGVKLVPMTMRETLAPFDINYAVWRELEIAQWASDLVINFVTPALPLFNQWSYVEGVTADLFENEAMHERFARSGATELALGSVRAARAALDDLPSALRNGRVAEMDGHLLDAVEFAQSYLQMSHVAMIHAVEDVGATTYSTARILRSVLTAGDTANTSDEIAAAILFQMAHGILCLQARAGVAHTDLHGNNVTIYPSGARHGEGGALLYEDPVVLMTTGPGADNAYVFAALGVTGCVIDFSRAILGPAARPRLEARHGPAFAAAFFRGQAARAVRALHRVVPPFAEKHETTLQALAADQPDALFAALCGADFVTLGRTMALVTATAVRLGGGAEAEVDPGALARLARRLEDEALAWLMAALRGLVEAQRAGRRAEPAALPGPALLARVFDSWRWPTWSRRGARRAPQLVDIWRADAPLRYSGDDYARFPPWARLDEMAKHLGDHDTLEGLFDSGGAKFLEALGGPRRVELVAEQNRAEAERLDGRRDPGSSWIDE